MTLRLSALAPIAAAILCSGCEQPKPVEVATPADREAAAKRTPKPTPTPRQRAAFTQRDETPAPTPPPPAEEDGVVFSKLLKPKDFLRPTGEDDGEGGWRLTRSDMLEIPSMRIPFEIYQAEIEVKGQPTSEIWPEFTLAFHNLDENKNMSIMPLRSNFAASTKWHVQTFSSDTPVRAGNYRILFRMMNPHFDEATSKPRVLHVRHIAIKGIKDLSKELIPPSE